MLTIWFIVALPVALLGLAGVALLGALQELGDALESLDLELRGV